MNVFLIPVRANSLRLVGDPEFVPRVLDVQKNQLCYIIGTVYMEMPMKPNVLDDIARDVSTSMFSPIARTYTTVH